MAFLPYNPNQRHPIVPADPLVPTAPSADDWHAQWGGNGGIRAPSPYFDPGSPLYGQTPPPLGGTPQASGPGGSVGPLTPGTQPPPMPDWSQYRGQNQLGSPPGVDWNQGYGKFRAAPDWRADLGRGVSQWDQATSAPATQPGGYTPLSQLGRGGGGAGGGLDVRRAAEMAAQMAPQYGPDQYLGGTGYQTRWKTGAAPMPAPDATATGSVGGGGMVLLRAPNGQTRSVPGDQVAHYLARGATRG